MRAALAVVALSLAFGALAVPAAAQAPEVALPEGLVAMECIRALGHCVWPPVVCVTEPCY